MSKFRAFERRLDTLEKKVVEEHASHQNSLLESQLQIDLLENANILLDHERFSRWFKAQKNEQKEDHQIPLDEELLWNKYKNTVLDNPWVKWKPLITENGRSPQTEFLLRDDLEVFYGGAGGGGKSVALLAGALQYVDQPGYSALILRRRMTDLSLPDSLLDLAHKLLDGTKSRFDSKNSTFVFPSGSRLVFGYCDNLGDEQRYRSAQFQYIGVDELTQWNENQYKFLFSRLRKPKTLNIPLRMRSASNPGDVGHGWVKERFINKTSCAQDRVFIPAKLSDNPMLDQEGYTKSLMNLDPVTRAQILDGDWEINPLGRIFQRGWFKIVDDYPRSSRIVRYWDKAATEPERGKDPDFTAGVKATLEEGILYVIDVERFRGTPQLNESTIRQTAEIDGLDVDIYMEQEPGSAGVNDIDNYARKVLLGYSFRPQKNTGSKQIRANPLSSAAEMGNVKLVRGAWNGDFLDEFLLFPNGAHDDQVDACSGAFNELASGGGEFDVSFGKCLK